VIKNNWRIKINVLPSIITRKNGVTIAYDYISGKSPGVIFLPGLKSNMLGIKAEAVRSFCEKRGQAFLRFDYTGHGQSSGSFEDGSIGAWLTDTIFVLEELAIGPQLLVGSSMGGWIMLLVALQKPERIAAMIGLAAAPDFTENLIWRKFDNNQKARIKKDGYIDLPNCYDIADPYRITYKLIKDGRRHLILKNQIPINIPIRLIHGICDNDVPYTLSQKLLEKMQSNDIEIILTKQGDHRLSSKTDLKRLSVVLKELLNQVEKSL
jgi:pimeloyl-ACP methyl ester carboxylesterase